MQARLCRHIKTDGLQCHGVAVSGSPFCYFHRRLNRAHDLYRDKIAIPGFFSHPPYLSLPALEDPASIQIAISTIVNALATRCIEERQAYALFKGIRLALDSCRHLRIADRPSEMVTKVEKETWTAIPEANVDLAPEGRTTAIPDSPPLSPPTPDADPDCETVSRDLDPSAQAVCESGTGAEDERAMLA